MINEMMMMMMMVLCHQGDLERLRDSINIIMTLHDVGSSFTSLKKFTDHEDMDQVKARCLFIHIALPGQSAEADKLNKPFPSVQVLMRKISLFTQWILFKIFSQDLGLNLVTVLDQLRIQRVVLLGDGAGGNIALRYLSEHSPMILL